jgi:CelD/BcsL family acetyltransferase involved in cellulose biosynthesis
MSKTPSAILATYGRRPAEHAMRLAPVRLKAESAALPGIRFAIHDDLAAAEPAWRHLEPNADCTIFQNFDYLAAWQRHIGARERTAAAIVSIHDPDDIIAILPLAVTGGVIRRLTWLGQDLCDYPGPLLAREFTRLVPTSRFTALWREINVLLQSDHRLRHDLIELCKMPETIGAQANPFTALARSLHPSEAFVATLDGNWDVFYQARRSAKARRQDRSKMKRLAELGDIRVLTAGQGDRTARAMQTLFAQKAETFARKGLADVFRRPGYREFFLDLASNPRTRDLAHVSELRVGATVAAISFGLEYRDRYSLCLVSYDESLSRFSPGAIHLNELMHRAVDRALHEFDFLVGFQRLKREWADRRIPLCDHIRGTTVAGHIAAATLRARARLKRAIKASPVLWDTYLSFRAWLGGLTSRIGGIRSGA